MATVRFRLNHLKKAGQESKPKAILVEFYQNRTKVELSTGDKVLVEHWDGSRVNKAAKGFSIINKNLARIEMELLNLDRGARGEELKGLVRGIVKGEDQPDQKKNLIDSVQQFIAQYSREKETGTVKRYKSLLSKLIQYGKPLSFETLDHNFYDGFKKFLYQTPNPLYVGHSLHRNDDLDCYEILPNSDGLVIGLFDDVVFKYFINLKTVCKWAEKRGHQVHEAHKSWEIIKRDYDPIYLTAEELDRLESVHLPKHLDIARDYLVLECRTGQRISDLKRFTRADIQGDVWTFKQKKR